MRATKKVLLPYMRVFISSIICCEVVFRKLNIKIFMI